MVAFGPLAGNGKDRPFHDGPSTTILPITPGTTSVGYVFLTFSDFFRFFRGLAASLLVEPVP